MNFITNNEGNYHWVNVSLTPLEDASLIARIKKKALAVSGKVNPKNLGREIRADRDKYIHCLSGIFAEEVVKGYLHKLGVENNLNLEIVEEEFNSYETHIDVKIKLNEVIKTIEVRSSFQYLTSLSNALNGKFALIGIYTHKSKIKEDMKDFHVTVFHRCKPEEFENYLEKFNPETLIIGGISKEDLIKYGKKDEGKFKQQGTEYLEIRPIKSAPKDTVDLFRNILDI